MKKKTFYSALTPAVSGLFLFASIACAYNNTYATPNPNPYDKYAQDRLTAINAALDQFDQTLPAQTPEPELKTRPIPKAPPVERSHPPALKEHINNHMKTEKEPIQKTDNKSDLLKLFLERVDFGLTINDVEKVEPKYYLETVFPLYQSYDKTHTVFSHDRVASRNTNDLTASMGLGYRRLVNDNNLMLGINGFFDYGKWRKHARFGAGLEAISKTLEARANYYNAFSEEKIIEQTLYSDTYERAMDGYDIEIGGPLPYLPWLKVYGAYTFFESDYNENISTFKKRVQISPFQSDLLTVNLESYDEKINGSDYAVDVRCSFKFASLDPKDMFTGFEIAPKAFPDVDLVSKTLDRVERNFNIVTETDSTPVDFFSNIQLIVRFPGVNPVTTDDNANGFVDGGELFELDFLLTNDGTETISGVQYSATIDSPDGVNIYINAGSRYTYPDVGPSSTYRTDTSEDLDIDVPEGVAAGSEFDVVITLLQGHRSGTFRFGPFVVGDIADDQVFDME